MVGIRALLEIQLTRQLKLPLVGSRHDTRRPAVPHCRSNDFEMICPTSYITVELYYVKWRFLVGDTWGRDVEGQARNMTSPQTHQPRMATRDFCSGSSLDLGLGCAAYISRQGLCRLGLLWTRRPWPAGDSRVRRSAVYWTATSNFRPSV